MCIYLPQALVTVADFGYPVQAFWFYCCQKLIWLSNLSILSVPDEGYSRNASCALNQISTFLFGMSRDGMLSFIFNQTYRFDICKGIKESKTIIIDIVKNLCTQNAKRGITAKFQQHVNATTVSQIRSGQNMQATRNGMT